MAKLLRDRSFKLLSYSDWNGQIITVLTAIAMVKLLLERTFNLLSHSQFLATPKQGFSSGQNS